MKYIYSFFIAAFLMSCGDSEQKSAESKSDTDSILPNLVSKEISYEGDSITMKGYLVYDENVKGPRPGVLVVHEWWGHNQHSRNAADKLAKDGYIAFALDMYGDGKKADHPEDAMAFSGQVMNDFEGAKKRFISAMETLKQDEHTDKDKIAAIGYCFGGGIVLNMAREGADLDGVATFHGSLGAVHPAGPGDIKAQVLVMTGVEDPFIPQTAVAAFKHEMDSAQVKYQVINYPNAKHAFTNPDATDKGIKFNLPLEYNKVADEDSWKKLEAFLHEVFQ